MQTEAFAMAPEVLAELARTGSPPQADADLPAVSAFIASAGLVRVNGTVRAGADHGLGVLPIFGPIWSRMHWAALASDFSALIDDPEIRAIVLDLDSPGGLLTGTQEFAELVYQARGRKPITAHIGGLGASAAYWAGSAADEVVIAETGQAGSIGVAATHIDFTGFDEKIGIKEISIISSQSPDKNRPPTDEKGSDLAQRRVDDLAAVFVGVVARNRGVTTQTVRQRFGQGDVLVGKRAVEAGLADRLGSFEALIAAGVQGAQADWIRRNVAFKHHANYFAAIESGASFAEAATSIVRHMKQESQAMAINNPAPTHKDSHDWGKVAAKFKREHEQQAGAEKATSPRNDPHGWGKVAAKFGAGQ